MIDIFLFIIIIALIGERSIISIQHRKEKQQLLDELSKATKAIIAKNAHEYVMTTSIDKVASEPQKQYTEPDSVPEDQLSDEEFFKAISKNIEADKNK